MSDEVGTDGMSSSLGADRLVNAIADVGLCVLDGGGRVVSWNPGAERIEGWPAEDIVGRHFSLLFPPADIAAGVPDRELLTVREKGVYQGEDLRLRKDGTTFVAQVTITPLTDEAGRPIGYAAVTRDISERVAAGEALKGREAQLRSILDTVPEAIIVIDRTGRIQMFSRSAERLFGYAASEVLAENVKMLMPSPYHEQHDGYLERYLETGQRRIIGIGRVVVGLRKDGSTFPMELAVGEMRLESGRHFTGFVRDLTERQDAEARFQELQAEIVHMSRLTALGEMASALAHEINQPLTAVTNYLKGCRRLLEHSMSKQQKKMLREAVEKAAEQSLRAGEIIRHLREFVARGESEVQIERLPKLIHEASALALVGAKERGIRVAYHFDPAAELVIADRIQIQQVLLNLIRNAIEAMEESPKRELTIATRSLEAGMSAVSVADTGTGLAREVAEQLFRPFVTTKAQGMGVGLSVCRTIIEGHGGTIEAQSRPGEGTTFRFTLRRVNKEEFGSAR